MTKAEKAQRNRYATLSNIIAFKSKAYFQSKSWVKDKKCDISKEMDFLMSDWAANDIEYFEDKIISLNAETKCNEKTISDDVRSCYYSLGKREPLAMYRIHSKPAAIICNRLKEAPAMQELYVICIEILKRPHPEKNDIFELLYFASRCTDKFEKSVKTQTSIFPAGEEDAQEVYRHIIEDGIRPFGKTLDPSDELFSRMPYRGVPKFPLVSLFHDFTE